MKINISEYKQFIKNIYLNNLLKTISFIENVLNVLKEKFSEIRNTFFINNEIINFSLLEKFSNSINNKYRKLQKENNYFIEITLKELNSFLINKIIREYKKTFSNNKELNSFLRNNLINYLEIELNNTLNEIKEENISETKKENLNLYLETENLNNIEKNFIYSFLRINKNNINKFSNEILINFLNLKLDIEKIISETNNFNYTLKLLDKQYLFIENYLI